MDSPFLGQGEQLLLDQLDLLAAALRLGGVEGAVDRVLADPDQPALESEVVDQPAVVGGVDDGFGRLRQAAEIARTVELAQCRIFFEQALEGDRVGDLAAPDRLDAALEDPGVHRLEEMLRRAGSRRHGDRPRC